MRKWIIATGIMVVLVGGFWISRSPPDKPKFLVLLAGVTPDSSPRLQLINVGTTAVSILDVDVDLRAADGSIMGLKVANRRIWEPGQTNDVSFAAPGSAVSRVSVTCRLEQHGMDWVAARLKWNFQTRDFSVRKDVRHFGSVNRVVLNVTK
jgi:hypothetical protein